MTKPRIVFGAGGHAIAVIDVLRRAGVAVAAVVDPSRSLYDLEHIRDDDVGIQRALEGSLPAVVAIGDVTLRMHLIDALDRGGVDLPAVRAVTATVAEDALLDVGSMVLEHAHIGPSVVIGRGCIVNTASIVEHDCQLGDGVHIGPGAVLTGAVTCGRRVLIGAGAVVLPGRQIGAGGIVGAGSVVTDDVGHDVTVTGIPAAAQRQ